MTPKTDTGVEKPMREIKFRAWDKADLLMMDNLSTHRMDNTIVVMQFTGLKDKNGKEIYEGDIITDHETCNFLVAYDKGCFFSDAHGDKQDRTLLYNHTFMEVIGNVYENGELLDA
jgi:uncharacterized phage protein (TIGR01671 family)